jgi:radical SAM protein with 4Fe4S-binding SPASM domain
MIQFEQAIAELEKTFNVVGTVNLNDPQLYQRLQSLYQPIFNPDDRIVIVQDTADVYDYADLPGREIIALQKYLRQIDISNCFVIVISGNANVASELKEVKNLYAADDSAIDHVPVDVEIAASVVVKKDTFCPLPWMHLYVGTDGNVLPCCVADHRYPMGNIEESAPVAIANNVLFKQIRNNMLTGIRSKECAACYLKEDAGLPSPRLEHVKRWSVDTASEFKPVYLDIRLNNICNLKCRMCSSYFSSAIAQEDIEIYGHAAVASNALRNRQRKEALSEIIEFLPHAEKIYFAGGEPLLAPEHYKILQQLAESGNTKLELFYNTNFTKLQFKNINVLEQWQQFSNVTVGASLDAMGSVAEYVRHGTAWAEIENNVNQLQQQCPHVNFTVTSAVGFMNVESLIQLQKTWHQTGRLNISKFTLTVMTGPDHLTVSVLPTNHKERLDRLVSRHILWCQQQGAETLATQWQDMLNYMWAKDSSHYLNEFRRITKTQDAHRNESFEQVFPVYKDLL